MGVAPFRSPLLRGSRLIPLPPGTEMFQFPGFAPHLAVTGVPAGRVSPFGHPGLIARVQLPPAYRGLPRPSSPPCAQASPTGLLSLDSAYRQAHNAQWNAARRSSFTSVCPLGSAGRSRRSAQITVSIPFHSLSRRLSHSSWYPKVYRPADSGLRASGTPRNRAGLRCVEACDYQ